MQLVPPLAAGANPALRRPRFGLTLQTSDFRLQTSDFRLQTLGLRQRHAHLPLVFAASVFVRHLANVVFVALKKQHLRAALARVDFGRQRRGV